MNSTISAPCVYNVNSERLGGTSRHNIWQHIEGWREGEGGGGTRGTSTVSDEGIKTK